MSLTGRQVREARELLGWSRADLSRHTPIPLPIVEVVEDHGSTFMLLPGQAMALRRAFEAAGVESCGGGARLSRSDAQ